MECIVKSSVVMAREVLCVTPRTHVPCQGECELLRQNSASCFKVKSAQEMHILFLHICL